MGFNSWRVYSYQNQNCHPWLMGSLVKLVATSFWHDLSWGHHLVYPSPGPGVEHFSQERNGVITIIKLKRCSLHLLYGFQSLFNRPNWKHTCVCMCVCACMHVCVSMHMYVCVFVCVYMYMCMYVYEYVCVGVYVCIWVCMHMYECMWVSVCVYVCMCVCVCECMYMFVHVCMGIGMCLKCSSMALPLVSYSVLTPVNWERWLSRTQKWQHRCDISSLHLPVHTQQLRTTKQR